MVDVNRIRARAADWLGDAGDAALRAVARRVRGSRIPDEVMRAWRERGTRPGEVPSAIIGDPALPDEDEDAATDPSVEPASGGPGPWRGLVHEVRECRVLASTWRAEAVGPDGQVYTALLMEPDAEERAREYAALMSAPLPCTPVLLVDGAHARIGVKPDVVILCHRWTCAGIDGELEVVEIDLSGGACTAGLAPVGGAEVVVRAREADMLGLKEWRFLG